MPNVIMMTDEAVSAVDITGSLDTFFEIATKGGEFVVANPILAICFVGSLAYMGLSFFGKAKKTARK